MVVRLAAKKKAEPTHSAPPAPLHALPLPPRPRANASRASPRIAANKNKATANAIDENASANAPRATAPTRFSPRIAANKKANANANAPTAPLHALPLPPRTRANAPGPSAPLIDPTIDTIDEEEEEEEESADDDRKPPAVVVEKVEEEEKSAEPAAAATANEGGRGRERVVDRNETVIIVKHWKARLSEHLAKVRALEEKVLALRFSNSEVAEESKAKYQECQAEMASLLAGEDAPEGGGGGKAEEVAAARHQGGGANTSAVLPTLSPIQLGPPPGPREVIVDYDKAVDIVKHWKEQLSEHLAKVRAAVVDDDAPPLTLCDRINLSGKSYTAAGARVIASFISEPLFDDVPSLARGIVEADLTDMIASRMTEEGLLVLQILCGAFADSSNLVDVDLSENAIGEQAIGACEAVLTKKSLERLCLNNAGLALETMSKLADILTRDEDGTGCVARKLTKFQISRNTSADSGCTAFARIFKRCTKIEDLGFAGTRPTPVGSDIVASALDLSLNEGHNAYLMKLDLRDNFFQSKASREALFRALQAATSLAYLDLGCCELEDDGIKKVCHALFACSSTLEHLDLSGNDVTRHGAKHIADYIRDCGGNLKTLRLEDNQELTSKGAVIIASAFRGSEDGHNIEEIQLNNCMIGAIGARALIDAFGLNGKDLPKLTNIFLNDNSFSVDILSELKVAFDYRLGELNENDSDGDADDELSDDEEEDVENVVEEDGELNENDSDGDADDEPDEEEDVENMVATDSVDELAEAMLSFSLA